LADVIGQLTHFDRLARAHAREHDRSLRLVVDLTTGRIRRTDRRGADEACPPLQLPSDYRISRLIVREQDMSYGSVSITCSRLGLTPSYAMLIEGPANQRKWILTAGLTGKHLELDTEREVRNILA
ncbi:unnamed protein product, partial [marine sediment metagenome]